MIFGNAILEENMPAGTVATFQENLITLLKVRSISKAEFARRVGVDSSTVVGWTKGYSSPSFKQLDKIASALSVTVADLFAENAHHANEKITLEQALAVVNDHLGYHPPKKNK